MVYHELSGGSFTVQNRRESPRGGINTVLACKKWDVKRIYPLKMVIFHNVSLPDGIFSHSITRIEEFVSQKGPMEKFCCFRGRCLGH